MFHHVKTYQYYAFLGTLPFIGCTLLFLMGYKAYPILGSIRQVIEIYGLVIGSFMAGTFWGVAVSCKDKIPKDLLLFSNIWALILWVAFLWPPELPFPWILAFAFFVYLWFDGELLKRDLISDEYFQTRFKVTLIVNACLITSGFFS